MQIPVSRPTTLQLYIRAVYGPIRTYSEVQCPSQHCTSLGSLEHQALPGPCGKPCCFRSDASASGGGAFALLEQCAPPSSAASAVGGAGAFALAWVGIRCTDVLLFFVASGFLTTV
jgi:hypothetical protein